MTIITVLKKVLTDSIDTNKKIIIMIKTIITENDTKNNNNNNVLFRMDESIN